MPKTLCDKEVRFLGRRVNKHLYLDQDLLSELEDLVRQHGDTSLSNEANKALRLYVRQAKGDQDDNIMAPVFQRLLEEKFAQQESWLRPGVWGGATYAATATLALLEILCGVTVTPAEAQAHLELIRGRAWKMVRRSPELDEGR